MSTTTRPAIAAILAVAAVLAGCQRGGTTDPTAIAGNPIPPSATTAPAPRNLVTPETAGKPVLDLKFGEPVVFRKGGITLTITAQSLAKLDGAPPDQTDPSEGCGVWWKLTDEIVVDAEPNATWKDWAVDLSGFGGIQQGTRDGEYAQIPVVDSGTGPDRLFNLTTHAEAEREKNPGAPFHKTLESKRYYGMCEDDKSQKPSGLEPLGVEASIDGLGIRKSAPATTIARWTR